MIRALRRGTWQMLQRKRSRKPTAFLYGGEEVPVFADARTSLKVVDLFNDGELYEELKAEILLRLLFPDPAGTVRRLGAGFKPFLSELLWELCGLDVDGTRSSDASGERVIDFKHDSELISASVMAAYGRSFDELASQCTLRELTVLLGLAPYETPLGQAVYYRTAKPPKATKYNKEEVARFKRLQEHYRIKDQVRVGDSMQRQSQAAFDAFKSLSISAKRG